MSLRIPTDAFHPAALAEQPVALFNRDLFRSERCVNKQQSRYNTAGREGELRASGGEPAAATARDIAEE
ncbi:hypothetical protein [Streptomyces triculaminicus]|uniref:hypothetical protein n=1 Tax=Streptomyces triculaminicus TaxID=2816232 RepID=UPI003FD7A9AD